MKALFLQLKRIIYSIIHGKKDLRKRKTVKWYDKENCKCYECLTNESKDCFANCLPATGFEYNVMPCMSCEMRSWCYTKHE